MKEMKELKNSRNIEKGREEGESDSRMRISALGLRQVNGTETETDAERKRRVMQIVCKCEEGSSST